VRILITQQFDPGHRGVVVEDFLKKPIDLDRVIARKIPGHTDIAGGRLHYQSPDICKEFENLLKRLARCRTDRPKTGPGEHDLPRTISCYLGHGFDTPASIASLPVFSAALAIPDLPTLIFSAYCNGMRGDFQPPACVIAARSDLLRARPSRAEAKASLTLSDLGGFLLEDIARYHGNKHRSLGHPPRLAWESGCSRLNVVPRLPPDPTRFRREFLPVQRRVIGREGIELFGLKYSCEAMSCEVRTSMRRVVRFDPRDLSQVYLERDRAEPLVVPLRDKVIPAMSIWEWNGLRKAKPECLQADGHEVRAALAQTSNAVDPVSTMLRARRLSARKSAWRELQKIAAMPGPDTTLETTMTSSDIGSFSWEVLE
jgi:hypothetical protein